MYLLVRPLVEGRTVLDLGCGLGEGAQLLAEARPARLLGWDAGARGLPAFIEVPSVDETTVALPAGSVDVVVCVDLLDRQPHLRERWLVEMRRLLSPEGFAVLVFGGGEQRPLGEAQVQQPLDYWGAVDLVEGVFSSAIVMAQTPQVGCYLSFLSPQRPAEHLTLLDDLTPGTYTLVSGFYRPDDGFRLTGADGATSLTIAEIEIAP